MVNWRLKNFSHCTTSQIPFFDAMAKEKGVFLAQQAVLEMYNDTSSSLNFRDFALVCRTFRPSREKTLLYTVRFPAPAKRYGLLWSISWIAV